MPAISSLYLLLNATTEITDNVASYSFDTGQPSIPAIFSLNVAPEDAEDPFILLREVAGGSADSFSDRTYRSGFSAIDIVVSGKKRRTSKNLRDLSIEVWTTVNRIRLIDPDDVYEMFCSANYPLFIEGEDGFPNYIVSCSVSVREK